MVLHPLQGVMGGIGPKKASYDGAPALYDVLKGPENIIRGGYCISLVGVGVCML